MGLHERFILRRVNATEIDKQFLCYFVRDETISRVWRVLNDTKELVNVNYKEQWNREDLEKRSLGLIETINNNGIVVAAFDKKQVIAFASIEGHAIGTNQDYRQLSQFHVSSQYRNKGVGKALFKCVEENARNLQIQKLYISSSSSEHTLRFYESVGCVDAKEVNQVLAQKEPFDIQLEYSIK